MPRRLQGSDRRRELAIQVAAQARISAGFERSMRREISGTMRAMIDRWERSGNVPHVDEHTARVQRLLMSDWSSATEWAAGRMLELVGKGGRAPAERKAEGQPLFERIAQDYLIAFGGEKIQQITTTTQTQIIRQIRAGQEEGLGTQEIARLVRGRVGPLSAYRSAVIARTETHSAAGFATQRAAEETGIEMLKEWISAEDARTREDHAAADGQTVPLSESFEVGADILAYPGDPSASAEQTIQCRCVQGHLVI